MALQGLKLEPSKPENETMTCKEPPVEKSETPIPEQESEMIHKTKTAFLESMNEQKRYDVEKMSDKIMSLYC